MTGQQHEQMWADEHGYLVTDRTLRIREARLARKREELLAAPPSRKNDAEQHIWEQQMLDLARARAGQYLSVLGEDEMDDNVSALVNDLGALEAAEAAPEPEQQHVVAAGALRASAALRALARKYGNPS